MASISSIFARALVLVFVKIHIIILTAVYFGYTGTMLIHESTGAVFLSIAYGALQNKFSTSHNKTSTHNTRKTNCTIQENELNNNVPLGSHYATSRLSLTSLRHL